MGGGKIRFISDKSFEAGMQMADLYDLSTETRYILTFPCLWLNFVKLTEMLKDAWMNEAIGRRSVPRPALIVTLFLC